MIPPCFGAFGAGARDESHPLGHSDPAAATGSGTLGSRGSCRNARSSLRARSSGTAEPRCAPASLGGGVWGGAHPPSIGSPRTRPKWRRRHLEKSPVSTLFAPPPSHPEKSQTIRPGWYGLPRTSLLPLPTSTALLTRDEDRNLTDAWGCCTSGRPPPPAPPSCGPPSRRSRSMPPTRTEHRS